MKSLYTSGNKGFIINPQIFIHYPYSVLSSNLAFFKRHII